jgi:hypothetical protein
MPRYALGDADAKALVAYLRTLSATPSPGVTAEELHFATVVLPDVAPSRRAALLSVLQAFVADKNAGTRHEVQRREAGTEREYRSYRRWVLHVWDLSGPAETWERQLEEAYDRRPVFALLSGLGAASWAPVHRFAERMRLPCLFPQADLPALSEPGFYTVYLSRGISLEAEALAKHLRERPAHGPVVQVFRREEVSAAAAAAFREAMAPAGVPVEDLAVDAPPDRAFWERLASEREGATLVVWLRGGDLAGSGALAARGDRADAIYLSATLLGNARPELVARGGDRVRLVLPVDLPRPRQSRLLRVQRWLREKGIPVTDERVQMNAYFAVTVTADVMAHVADLFSRDYLVERVEHVVGNTSTPSVYPRVSLGPGQRFASKGSFIVKVGAGRGEELEPLSGWITP